MTVYGEFVVGQAHNGREDTLGVFDTFAAAEGALGELL